MAKLLFVVPASRAYCGRGVMVSRSGETLFGPFRALATASARVAKRHGNPGCDPVLPFGHTPAGGYIVAGSLPAGRAHLRRPERFGVVGALLLRPVSGRALDALGHGRSAFSIHGGPLDDAGRLVATRGGLRLADAEMDGLLRAVNAAQLAGDPLSSVEVVEVTPADLASVPPVDRRGSRRTRSAPARDRGAGRTRGSRRAFFQTALLLVGGLSAAACDTASDVCSPCERGATLDGGLDDSGLAGGLDAGAPALHCHKRRFMCTDADGAVFYSDVDVTGSTDTAGDYEASSGGVG